MKRFGFLLLFNIIAFVLIAIPPSIAQSDKMLLDSSGGRGKKRPPVNFPHNHHVEKGLACKDCHHLYQKGENVLDESKLIEGNKEIQCSACHGPKSRFNLVTAYHSQCIGCHKKPVKDQKRIPPRYCGGCHVRK